MSSTNLKTHIQRLDTTSGIVFFIGAALLKIQPLIPEAFIAMIMNSIALAFYGIGYLLWLVEAMLNPNRRQNPNEWYGFASIKAQFTATAVIGLIATALGISAIFFPVLLIPACWLFTISNIFWLIGEHHKTENPPDSKEDPTYQPAKQKAYFHYVQVVSMISLISTIITTVAIFFPPFLWVALFIGPYLGGMVLKAGYDLNFGSPPEEPKAVNESSTSYIHMNDLMPGKEHLPPPANSTTPKNKEEPHDQSRPALSGIHSVAVPKI